MNFFQVPNFLWDRDDLDVYERVVLTHIIRKTIGWGKSSDGISLSQFQKTLGISKNSVIKALKKLTEKNIIKKTLSFYENGGQSYNIYSLTKEVIKEANKELHSKGDLQGVVHEKDRGSSSDEQGVVHEKDTQNTTNTKNTNTKEKEKNSLRSNTPKGECDSKSEDEVKEKSNPIREDNKDLIKLVDWYFKVLKMINPNYNDKQIANNRLIAEKTFRDLKDFGGYEYKRVGRLIDRIRLSNNKYFRQKLMNIKSFAKVIDEAEAAFPEEDENNRGYIGLA